MSHPNEPQSKPNVLTSPEPEPKRDDGSPEPKHHFVTVRMPDRLVSDLDQEVQRRRALLPGVTLTRSDVVREILLRAFAGTREAAT